MFKIRPVFLPQWRRVVGFGCVFGILNTGLVITLGQMAFFGTPMILITFIGLFCREDLIYGRAKNPKLNV